MSPIRPSRSERADALCAAALAGLGPGETVDVGRAPSRWSSPERGALVTGLDVAENRIRAARERPEAAGLAERRRFAVGNVARMDLPDAGFYVATAGFPQPSSSPVAGTSPEGSRS